MAKQISKAPPVYKGDDPKVREWANSLVQFLNQELLRITGDVRDVEETTEDHEARMDAHGI